MDWQWLYVGVRKKQRDRLISGEVQGLRMPLYPILRGWVFIAWPWCHLGSTCRAFPFRSLLPGHHLSGATPQTLLWGLQESSRIRNPSAKAKGRCGVQFQLHIGITMELLKKSPLWCWVFFAMQDVIGTTDKNLNQAVDEIALLLASWISVTVLWLWMGIPCIWEICMNN